MTDNTNVEAAVAMIIAACMQDKPVYKAHLESLCDEDSPEELIEVLDEAAYYGVEVRE